MNTITVRGFLGIPKVEFSDPTAYDFARANEKFIDHDKLVLSVKTFYPTTIELLKDCIAPVTAPAVEKSVRPQIRPKTTIESDGETEMCSICYRRSQPKKLTQENGSKLGSFRVFYGRQLEQFQRGKDVRLLESVLPQLTAKILGFNVNEVPGWLRIVYLCSADRKLTAVKLLSREDARTEALKILAQYNLRELRQSRNETVETVAEEKKPEAEVVPEIVVLPSPPVSEVAAAPVKEPVKPPRAPRIPKEKKFHSMVEIKELQFKKKAKKNDDISREGPGVLHAADAS